MFATLALTAAFVTPLPLGGAMENCLPYDIDGPDVPDVNIKEGKLPDSVPDVNIKDGKFPDSTTTSQEQAQYQTGPGDCDVPVPAICLDEAYDLTDVDMDFLSDRVEVCWLGTSMFDPDTDGDGVPDGLDGAPAANVPIPLHITVTHLNQIHDNNECDQDNRWDPYFTAFGYDIDSLRENIEVSWSGWTIADHEHDRLDIVPFASVGEAVGGTGNVTGATVDFSLDPDLTKWNGGLRDLDLQFRFGVMVADHDHHWPDGNDDYMSFSLPDTPILKLGGLTIEFDSEHAGDADTDHIHCQAQVVLKFGYDTLTEQILDTAAAKMLDPGSLIACNHPWLNGCVLDDSWAA